MRRVITNKNFKLAAEIVAIVLMMLMIASKTKAQSAAGDKRAAIDAARLAAWTLSEGYTAPGTGVSMPFTKKQLADANPITPRPDTPMPQYRSTGNRWQTRHVIRFDEYGNARMRTTLSTRTR